MAPYFCRVCILLVGVLLGILLQQYCTSVEEFHQDTLHLMDHSYNKWFKKTKLRRKKVLWDDLRYEKNSSYVVESDFLFKKISISCLILLNDKENAEYIGNTWAKGCNRVTFINVTRNVFKFRKKSHWIQLYRALHAEKNGNWFLIVGDNTFVIMENLRYFLAPFMASSQYYFGRPVKFWNTVYHSKEAGILLSKGTLVTLKKSRLKSKWALFSFGNREDYCLGKILARIGIKPSDTRDASGLLRFGLPVIHSLILTNHSAGNNEDFVFRRVHKNLIFTYGNHGNLPSSQADDDQVWKKVLKEKNITRKHVTPTYYTNLWETNFHPGDIEIKFYFN